MQKLAVAHQLEDPASSVEALLRFLRFWWCKSYNRPLKDPLLMSYTADELIYEYLRNFYSKPENDPKKKIEEEKAKNDDEEWIRKMLSQAPKEKAAAPGPPIKPKVKKKPKTKPKASRKKTISQEFPDIPDISAKFDPMD